MPARKTQQIKIRDINVIDMLLIDHRYLKECVEVFSHDNADKNKKLSLAKGFLEALEKHSAAEQEVVYAPLETEEEFHFNILEAEIEHRLVDEKVQMIFPQINRARVLKDETEAELKVLAELVKNHLKEEESELLPRMNEEIDEETLREMGHAFMEVRGLTPKDLRDYPHLQDELVSWKDDVQKISSQFLSKMDKYVENLKH